MKLYTTVEAVPSRLLGVIRLLTRCPQDLPRGEAITLLQPKALASNADEAPDMAPKVFHAALELGAIQEVQNEKGEVCLRLAADLRDLAVKPDSSARIRQWMSRRVLHDLAMSTSKTLSNVFGWILSVPYDEIPVSQSAWKQRFKDDGLSTEDFALNSDARWSNVFDWARYFGLIWQTNPLKGTGVVADPSNFLEAFLVDLLEPHETEISGFLVRLQEEYPLFATRSASTAAIGPGLTLALRALRERKRIALWHRDDADRTSLLSDGEKVGWIRRL